MHEDAYLIEMRVEKYKEFTYIKQSMRVLHLSMKATYLRKVNNIMNTAACQYIKHVLFTQSMTLVRVDAKRHLLF